MVPDQETVIVLESAIDATARAISGNEHILASWS
jgi:hypothetical protein